MAVVATDFIFPNGPFKPAQFGFTLDSELETHITDVWLDPLVVAVPTVTDDMKNAYVCWKANEVIAGAFNINSAPLKRKKVGNAEEQFATQSSNSANVYNDRALSCKDVYLRLLSVLDTTSDPDEFTILW